MQSVRLNTKALMRTFKELKNKKEVKCTDYHVEREQIMKVRLLSLELNMENYGVPCMDLSVGDIQEYDYLMSEKWTEEWRFVDFNQKTSRLNDIDDWEDVEKYDACWLYAFPLEMQDEDIEAFFEGNFQE